MDDKRCPVPTVSSVYHPPLTTGCFSLPLHILFSLSSASAVLLFPTIVTLPSLINHPPAHQGYHYKNQNSNTYPQIVAFYARPDIQHFFGFISEVTNHSATFHYFTVGILNLVNLYAVGIRAKEITQIGVIIQSRIYFLLQNLRSSDRTHISAEVHIP